jgi:UDPglucose--hexose-1-phosphate uridylyltransferase
MTHVESAQRAVEELLFFSGAKGLVEREDIAYARNLLLDVMHLDAPGEAVTAQSLPETATVYLDKLLDAAIGMGIIEDTITSRELFSTRLMGCVTPAPAIVRREFKRLYKAQGPEAATRWFYQLCRDCDYIRAPA